MTENKCAQPDDGPTELALCESQRLVLREGRTYRFVCVAGCETCAKLSAASLDAYGPAEVPASPWRPIETAPRAHGTRILVSWPMRELDDDDAPTGPIKHRSTLVTEMNGGFWLEPDVLNAAGAWFGDDYAYTEQPDLWQPLPDSPEVQP